jgi:hypothetical protein
MHRVFNNNLTSKQEITKYFLKMPEALEKTGKN